MPSLCRAHPGEAKGLGAGGGHALEQSPLQVRVLPTRGDEMSLGALQGSLTGLQLSSGCTAMQLQLLGLAPSPFGSAMF